jgi:DNA repair protein RecN (Recombination protein N)
MIVQLIVENLAIIERADVDFDAGFTSLTGETGAGKSLLIDAINLALGERSDSELVRSGAERASVSVVFELRDEVEALARCRELGVALEGTRLFVQRDVVAKGGSQCRIGGRLAPTGTLRKLGEVLVDLHGQHDHQRLLDPESHIGYLDDWIGEPAHAARRKVAEAFAGAEEARRRLTAVRAGLRDREQRLDLLRFQINEIEAAQPKPGETEELEARLGRLRHAERLATATFSALETLADGEANALDLLAKSIEGLESVLRYDSTLEPILGPLRASYVEIEEAAHALRSYGEALESDPSALDDVQLRLDTLKRLKRKYGATEAEVLDHLEAARAELSELEAAEETEDELLLRVEGAEGALREASARLTEVRKGRAEEFSQLVQAQLRDLAMERALFSVDFGVKAPDGAGGDAVEFHFSANAGEPPRPLSKIASGGEISRLMLAIKTALAGKAGVPTLIFDEVDVGLGGRAAATMARKLEELARHYQVIVISHLPQIASRAAAHFRIEKRETEGRVVTGVRRLDPADRVEEIARMLAGESITESALANARELLGLPKSGLFD